MARELLCVGHIPDDQKHLSQRGTAYFFCFIWFWYENGTNRGLRCQGLSPTTADEVMFGKEISKSIKCLKKPQTFRVYDPSSAYENWLPFELRLSFCLEEKRAKLRGRRVEGKWALN